MKKTVRILCVLSCLLSIVSVFADLSLAQANAQYKVGDKFTGVIPGSTEKYYILDYVSDDVNGDKVKDQVMLIGTMLDDTDVWVENVHVVIDDGKTNKLLINEIGCSEGIGPYLFLGDFTYDKVKDILVGINTGANGGAGVSDYDLYTLKNSKLVNLLDEKYGFKYASFSIKFEDSYKVKITCQNVKATYIVDVSDRKQDYASEDIYKNSKLVAPREGWIDPFNELKPIDIDHDGNHELVGYQYIAGIAHYDMLGQMVSTFKLDKKSGKWLLVSVKYQKP